MRTLEYKNETYIVMNAFSHSNREYVTIDVKDSDGNPYTICDRNDTLYNKIKTIKDSK